MSRVEIHLSSKYNRAVIQVTDKRNMQMKFGFEANTGRKVAFLFGHCRVERTPAFSLHSYIQTLQENLDDSDLTLVQNDLPIF